MQITANERLTVLLGGVLTLTFTAVFGLASKTTIHSNPLMLRWLHGLGA